jgi:4-hydroxy-L-threonine phosphate dehydrogenase PdxA
MVVTLPLGVDDGRRRRERLCDQAVTATWQRRHKMEYGRIGLDATRFGRLLAESGEIKINLINDAIDFANFGSVGYVATAPISSRSPCCVGRHEVD